MGTTIWSPLASGALTSKYNKGIPDNSRFNLPGYEWLKKEWQSPEGATKFAKIEKLSKLAANADMPIHHMALLWCLTNKNVSTVILGASKLSQLEDNLSALKNQDLLTSDLKIEIETILQNKPDGHKHY